MEATKKMTNRQINALKTRKRIYEAGLKLLKEKGYEHVMVADIAKEAGVSVGSFYTYFKSKECIVLEYRSQLDDISQEIYEDVKNIRYEKDIIEEICEYFYRLYIEVEKYFEKDFLKITIEDSLSTYKNERAEAEKDTNYSTMKSYCSELKALKNLDFDEAYIMKRIYTTYTGVEICWCGGFYDVSLAEALIRNLKPMLIGLTV